MEERKRKLASHKTREKEKDSATLIFFCREKISVLYREGKEERNPFKNLLHDKGRGRKRSASLSILQGEKKGVKCVTFRSEKEGKQGPGDCSKINKDGGGGGKSLVERAFESIHWGGAVDRCFVVGKKEKKRRERDEISSRA